MEPCAPTTRKTPSEDAEYNITTDWGRAPVWAHSGRELFYSKQSGALVFITALSISPGQAFDFVTAHQIAQGGYARPIFDREQLDEAFLYA